MITLLRTACNEYTIQNGGSNQTYEVTISNINGNYSQSWNIVDNADVLITFPIDGIYIFTSDSANLFTGNCNSIPLTGGGDGAEYVQYTIPPQFIAPSYTGFVISISIQTTLPLTYNFSYTVQPTDTSISVLSQNIANYINELAISGVTAVYTSGYLQINVPYTTVTGTAQICGVVWTQNLWSTCALWKCIQYLMNKIFCCKRRKCEEHTWEMQKERDELNRLMLFYSQFSMMNDDERWDYLPLNLTTDIQNDIFDKLNVITARCAHCCKDHKHQHQKNECDECSPQPVTEWCQKLPPEIVTISGTNVIPIES